MRCSLRVLDDVAQADETEKSPQTTNLKMRTTQIKGTSMYILLQSANTLIHSNTPDFPY